MTVHKRREAIIKRTKELAAALLAAIKEGSFVEAFKGAGEETE